MAYPADQEDCSLEHVAVSQLYPKPTLVSEDKGLAVPFPTLQGEAVCYLGLTEDGVIALSNFRLFIRHALAFTNVPLGLIDMVECRDIFYLFIYCKDARIIRCKFSTNDVCMNWFKHLNSAIMPLVKLQDLFAFAFRAWCKDALETQPESDPCLQLYSGDSSWSVYSFGVEVERLGFDLKTTWRLSHVNSEFSLCASYPKQHIVPKCISDKVLEQAASFRSSRRFPSIVWRDSASGAVLARSSQPEVGWLGWRSKEDEALLQAILNACSSTTTDPDTRVQESSSSKTLMIMDARSYTAAVANRAKGGGCEYEEYYPSCKIVFMNLANIHSIRKSFHALRALCAAGPDIPNWLTSLESTRWLQHIAGLMRASIVAVNALHYEQRPVLVHCSDGWDRTPQITALAKLILDPYYRTIEGFQVLVETEWLEFGHKFADRCGHSIHSDDANERCPVFLQWLDCIHQLLYQFPNAFEFNQAFLVKLLQHVYSCLFGNFLCNNVSERERAGLQHETCSVWVLLQRQAHGLTNCLYKPTGQVLRPSCQQRDMVFWASVYLCETALSTGPWDGEPAETNGADASATTSADVQQNLLPKTRSCDDIVSALEHTSSTCRRLSDPSIVTNTVNMLNENEHDTEINNSAIMFSNVSSKTDLEDTSVADSSIVTDQPSVTTSHAVTESLANNSPAVEESVSSREELCTKMNTCNLKTNICDPGDEPCDREPCINGDGVGGMPDVECKGNCEQPSGEHHGVGLSPGAGQCQKEHSFDGSTDTLIGEVATDQSRAESVPNPAVRQEATVGNDQDCSSLGKSASSALTGDTVCSDRSNSISTSTTDISDPHIYVHSGHMSQTWNIDQALINLSMHTSPVNESMPLQIDVGKFLRNSNKNSMSDSSSSLHNSQTPSSTTPPTPNTDKILCNPWGNGKPSVSQHLDIDGLTVFNDPVQHSMLQMREQYEAQIQALEANVRTLRNMVFHIGSRSNGTAKYPQDNRDEVLSQPESTGSGEHASIGSTGASDMSWEAVEEKDARMTLWVPDHAVTHCASCHCEFWVVKRKHHCRSCGRVFCWDCTNFSMPVPHQQLNMPVRVCSICYQVSVECAPSGPVPALGAGATSPSEAASNQ